MNQFFMFFWVLNHQAKLAARLSSPILLKLPSAYLTVRHLKSPCFIGKPSISMGHFPISHGYVSHNQRVAIDIAIPGAGPGSEIRSEVSVAGLHFDVKPWPGNFTMMNLENFVVPSVRQTLDTERERVVCSFFFLKHVSIHIYIYIMISYSTCPC